MRPLQGRIDFVTRDPVAWPPAIEFHAFSVTNHAVLVSPAKAGWRLLINVIRWWRATRLPPATIFHACGVKNPQNKNAATGVAAFLIT
jgi:hypothetical protein